MECKETQEYITDYLTGELDSVTEMRVSEHLLECRVCQEELKNLETLLATMQDNKKFTPRKLVLRHIKKSVHMEKRFNAFVFFNKPVKLYYAVSMFLLGIFLMSIPSILIKNRYIKSEETKVKPKARYETTTPDTIAFYAAPSHKLGGT